MPGAADPARRWDTDDRYTGVADARAFAPAIDELAALARRPGWVTEEPGAHLVPHLNAAEVPGLRLTGWHAGPDGMLDVTAQHDAGLGRGDLRQRAWSLIGAIAEPAASVRERPENDAVTFEILTGIPDSAGPFASHGHTVRLTIRLTIRPATP